jgi:hypothetical protein
VARWSGGIAASRSAAEVPAGVGFVRALAPPPATGRVGGVLGLAGEPGASGRAFEGAGVVAPGLVGGVFAGRVGVGLDVGDFTRVGVVDVLVGVGTADFRGVAAPAFAPAGAALGVGVGRAVETLRAPAVADDVGVVVGLGAVGFGGVVGRGFAAVTGFFAAMLGNTLMDPRSSNPHDHACGVQAAGA